MHTDWSSVNSLVLLIVMICLTFNKNPPIHSQLIIILHKTKKKKKFCELLAFWKVCSCTVYVLNTWSGVLFALITVSIQRGMEVISLWHCWGGMKPRFLWQWPSAHLHFLVSCFSFSSWQYLIDSLCSGLVSLIYSLCSGLVSLLVSQAHQQPCSFNFWCFWQCGQVTILLENEISIFKKLVSKRKHEVLQHFFVNGCSDVGFQKNTMDQHQQMTLLPNHHRLWKLKHWTSRNLGSELLHPSSRL